MRLNIDGEMRDFVSLADFRAVQGLPRSFEVAFFQPKVNTGLGSIDGAGVALGEVRTTVLNAVPARVPAAEWLSMVPRLAATFEGALNQANTAIGLREAEIAFAVGGFGDVCSAYGLALFRAKATNQPTPNFDDVYTTWLLETVRTAADAVPYPHNGETWRARVVYHAYGRVGLIVTTPNATHYVVDKTLACPAEGFMLGMLRAVAAKMTTATV